MRNCEQFHSGVAEWTMDIIASPTLGWRVVTLSDVLLSVDLNTKYSTVSWYHIGRMMTRFSRI